MKWWDYVQEVSGQASQTEIAKRLGLSQPGVSRWQTVPPKPESVITFARTYNRPLIEAFLAAEYLSAEDAAMTKVADASKLTNEELLTELRRRLPD